MEEIDLNDTVTVELTEWGAVYLNALNTFKILTTLKNCSYNITIIKRTIKKVIFIETNFIS